MALTMAYGMPTFMSIALHAGYCEQFDTHSSGTTVEEAVRTSGRLRLGSSATSEQVLLATSH